MSGGAGPARVQGGRKRAGWSAPLTGIVLLVLLFVGALAGNWLYYRHVGLFKEHRQEALRQLCGLVRPDAKPLLSYYVHPAGQADGYVYGMGLRLDDETAARIRAGGIESVLPRNSECVQLSGLLRVDAWQPGPVGAGMGATHPAHASGGVGLPPSRDPNLHVLSQVAGYGVDDFAKVVLGPGGLYLQHYHGHPHPFVYVNAERQLVLVTLFYWQGFPEGF